MVVAFLLIWLTHAFFGVVLSAPILFLGRKRIGWSHWLLLTLVIPFGVWLLLILSPLPVQKSMSNITEPLLIMVAMPVLAAARVLLGTRVPEKVQAVAFLTIMSAVAAAIYFFFPCLPE